MKTTCLKLSRISEYSFPTDQEGIAFAI
jgi:hypothetical protein